MSDVDSFIDEVTEEVRRDRMYLLLRRWGWVGVVAVVAIVGGAAFNEYRKASKAAQAEALGDSILAALQQNNSAERANSLQAVVTETPGEDAILKMLLAESQVQNGNLDAAVANLNAVAVQGDLPEIYRAMATFKALLLQSESLPAADRRQQFEALTAPGAPLRLLAEEQIALIDVTEGNTQAALDRLQTLRQDAEASTSLQQRAAQMIVALGGEPEPVVAPQG
ncbi:MULTISPECIES: tetratricopeptide repeat protein [unclassified Ruegeria]|uniref:tetratricopeptide repeat protein n=1 Tax=unclassified Ruegeria TaxID=2625375 RepID=UPI001489DB9B|nr:MULTISPECIES: tetratricopeptide repeat protein [unclassified Ruegeria]